jgi:large subunit ribosomal protein L23
MNTFEIIKTVRLTEKGTRLASQTVRKKSKEERPLNKYIIVADPRANKMQIRQAVQELFKVKVIGVNTMNCRGKYRRQRTHQAGQAPDWKKAIVTLKEGDKIVLT